MAFKPISVTHTTLVMRLDTGTESTLCVEHFAPIDGKMRLVSRTREPGRRTHRVRRMSTDHVDGANVVALKNEA